MVPVVASVRERQQDTHDTFTLTLSAPNEETAGFRPGQFNMLYLFGVGEAPISHSGDPHEGDSLVHTIRAVGSVTNALAALKPGDPVGVRGPFGSNWPMEEAHGHDVVIVAGGIGLAPLRPAIYHLLRHRDKYGTLSLLYGARTPDDLLYTDQLHEWGRRFDIEVFVTVDRGSPTWSGGVGLVTTLFPRVSMDADRTIGLVCGPEVMMRFVLAEFEKRGVADDRLYLSMERNMHCAIGFCGHCQLGPAFVCMDGPVFRYDRMRPYIHVREV